MTATKASDALSMALVPDKQIAKTYINRKFADGRTDFQIFAFANANDMNVLIEGPTGAAKTTAVMAYAAKNDLPFYSVSGSAGVEASQLFGKYIPDESGSGFVWQDGPVTHMFRYGGVLLLNEVNFIPDRVASVLFSALDRQRSIKLVDHKGEVIKAHKDLLILADMNVGSNYKGTSALNAAFRNRYTLKLAWDYQPSIERRLVKTKTIREIAAKLREQYKHGEFETPISTNMMMEFETIAAGLGVNFATQNFINAFHESEREAIDHVFKTFAANLADDFAESTAVLEQNGFMFEEDQQEEITIDVLNAMTLEEVTAYAVSYGIDPVILEGLTADGVVEFLIKEWGTE